MLLHFSFVSHFDQRAGRYWIRCTTIRRAAGGSWVSHFSDLSWGLGRRLADRLCDKYGITDRACLYSGRIFSIYSATEIAAMDRGFTTNERMTASGQVFGIYPQAISDYHAAKLDAANFGRFVS